MHPDRISEDGINLVKKFEGLHKVQPNGMVSAYRCSAGRYTCGYGATRGVRSGTKWTKEYCELRLIEDLNDHAKAIKKYVQVPLSQGQYDSLVSFIFNLGEGAFRSSTLLKKLNKGLYDEVPEQPARSSRHWKMATMGKHARQAMGSNSRQRSTVFNVRRRIAIRVSTAAKTRYNRSTTTATSQVQTTNASSAVFSG